MTGEATLGKLLPMIAAAAVLVVLGGCVNESDSGVQVPQDKVASLRLADMATKLPRSATDVWLYEARFQDGIQLVRFDATLAEARDFSRNALGHATSPRFNPHFEYLGRDRPWWLSSFPPGAEGGENIRADTRIRLVLRPGGDRARIWLAINST